MILNEEQLIVLRHQPLGSNRERHDLLDTIADLKRQLAERGAPIICTCNSHTPGFHDPKCARQRPRPSALVAYVQERVDRAVLAESEWWHAHSYAGSQFDRPQQDRLAANRAKVGEGKS